MLLHGVVAGDSITLAASAVGYNPNVEFTDRSTGV